MRIDRTTATLLAIALGAIFALAGWGHLLGLAPSTLEAVQAAAAALGALALAAARALLAKDADKDGTPDVFQTPKEPK